MTSSNNGLYHHALFLIRLSPRRHSLAHQFFNSAYGSQFKAQSRNYSFAALAAIFAQGSRNVTVRLKTRAPGVESGSTQK